MTVKPRNKKQNNRKTGQKERERAQRRAEAEARERAYSMLTAKEKLDKLDEMFGVGKGAKKQRRKLAAAC